MEAVQVKPIASAYSNVASLLMQLGRHEEALQAHKAAVELQPENGAVLTNAGWAYEQVGDYEQALALYQRAVAAEPNHSQIASNLANLQQRLRQATS